MKSAIQTRVYLIRHGETEWNQNQPGYCGWTDIPLNAKGIAQAEALADRFARVPLTAIFASDLRRSQDTAVAISRGRLPVHADARFRELNYGEWEGKGPEALEVTDTIRFEAWRADPANVAPPGGETLKEVVARSVSALEEWVERCESPALALVAHKTTVRLLLCWALGVAPSHYLSVLQQNAAINLIEFRSGRPVVGIVNDICHLPADLISPAM